MKKIYEDDFWYDRVRNIADPYIRGSFKKIRYEGQERIPHDGAVIFAPNHCDALMDPLAILAMDRGKKVFVARADIFKKPKLEKILTFFKIMPIHRVRDGFRNVLNTEKTIQNSIEVLNNRVPFCILPEGMHRSRHSLLPLGKGIARIALGADKRMEDGSRVYIVPVGCEYGDYYRYRSTLLVTIGEPIDISAYIAANAHLSEPELLSGIRELTAAGMKREIVYIPDDEDYAATWELAKLQSGPVPERQLRKRFEANRKAVERIERFREQHPEAARKLFEKAVAFTESRDKAKVSIHATYTRRPLLSALWNTLKALFYLPFALVLGTASLPSWVTAEILAGRVKDRTFHNSFRCASLIFTWTFLLIVWAIVLFCTLKWYWALAALAVLVPAPMLVYDYFELVRRCASSWRYLCNRRLKRQKEEVLNELNKL